MKCNLKVKVWIISLVAIASVGGTFYAYTLQNEQHTASSINLYKFVSPHSQAIIATNHFSSLLKELVPFDSCFRHSPYCISDLVRMFSPYASHFSEVIIECPSQDSDNQIFLGNSDQPQNVPKWIRHYLLQGVSVRTIKYHGNLIYVYPLCNGKFLTLFIGKEGYVIASFQLRNTLRAINTYLQSQGLYYNKQFNRISIRDNNKMASLYTSCHNRWYSYNLLFNPPTIIIEGCQPIDSLSVGLFTLSMLDTIHKKHYVIVSQKLKINNTFFPLVKLIIQ